MSFYRLISFLHMLAKPGLGNAQDKKPGAPPGSPTWLAEPMVLGPSPAASSDMPQQEAGMEAELRLELRPSYLVPRTHLTRLLHCDTQCHPQPQFQAQVKHSTCHVVMEVASWIFGSSPGQHATLACSHFLQQTNPSLPSCFSGTTVLPVP